MKLGKRVLVILLSHLEGHLLEPLQGPFCSRTILVKDVHLFNSTLHWLVNFFIKSIKPNMSHRNQISLGWLRSSGDRAHQLLFCHGQGKADVKILLDTLDIIAFRNHTYAFANDP